MSKYFFLSGIALIFYQCSPSKQPKDGLTLERNDLPPISLILSRGDTVKANTLSGKSILIFFVPDCDHCQRQAEDIHQHLDVFKNHSIYFIASNPLSEIMRFGETYGLQGYQNIFFARAEAEEVINLLGPMSVPTLYIYSQEKLLVSKLEGETSVVEISKLLSP